MSQESRFNPQAPTGLGRRRSRLSDQETERRMLRAALDAVNTSGLTVSLEHIGFEDVIRAADVSRSAAYRRWPYKDLFFSDLLKELAAGPGPTVASANVAAIEQVNRIILDHATWLREPPLRRALIAEVQRQQTPKEMEIYLESAEWRTYFALHATFRSLPDGDLRKEVRTALIASEGSLRKGLATAYERGTRLIGLRLRSDAGVTFETLADIISATVRGLVMMAPVNPGVSRGDVVANPFGAPEPARWSMPALAIAGAVVPLLEVDQGVDFDDERIARLRETLDGSDWATAGESFA